MGRLSAIVVPTSITSGRLDRRVKSAGDARRRSVGDGLKIELRKLELQNISIFIKNIKNTVTKCYEYSLLKLNKYDQDETHFSSGSGERLERCNVGFIEASGTAGGTILTTDVGSFYRKVNQITCP